MLLATFHPSLGWRRAVLLAAILPLLAAAMPTRSPVTAAPPLPPHAPLSGGPVLSPLMPVRFLLPPGVRITVYPATEQAQIFPGDALFGLRPGYRYCFEFSNLPEQPGAALYPTLEVHGSLLLRPGMQAFDYPATLPLSKEELQRAMAGAMIVKYVYLEDPQQAVPGASRPDRPIEIVDANELAARQAALSGGRLLLVLRLGDRRPTAQELQALHVPNTVLLPGQKRLAAPPRPPQGPVAAIPLFDPLVGPRPATEECFVNGGDRGADLGISPDQRLTGLDAGDVAVEYTLQRQRRVAAANPVPLCAPRFVVRKAEVLPAGVDARWQLVARHAPVGPMALAQRERAAAYDRPEGLREFASRLRPAAYLGQLGWSLLSGSSRPAAAGQVAGLQVAAVVVEPEQLTAYPGLAPLTVSKQIDPPGPKQVGDIVTITIRYFNSGTQVIRDVVVSDHLLPRLEYVPASAETDRAAHFTITESESGGQILRWEFTGELLPGRGGTVRFKARIR